jgi:multidrug efflux pump subunit AcrA (membrane-fusion protein)
VLILPPLAIGIVVVVLLAKSNEGPTQVDAVERRTSVRVLTARSADVVPRVIGYGVVEPGRVWQVVSQVAGRVVEKSPRAEAGASAAAGTVLLRIDPRPYELAVREIEAEITTLEAELVEIDTREENAQRTLEIEERSLQAYERELARKQTLLEDDIVTQSEVDQEESRTLQQLVRVADLRNTLKLVPAERQSLRANMLASEAKLDIAKLDLSYTTIEVPYDCRLVRVDFEEAQYVGVGEVLAEAHGVDVAEVAAQVPMTRMRHLIPDMPGGPAMLAGFLSGDVIRELGLEAELRLRSGSFSASWEARVARISAFIDLETRTLGVVVAVDDPYAKAVPGQRPPLVQDMFCEVEIRGRAKPDKVLIPRSALHDGEVYVASDGRLVRRPVEVAFTLGDFVCLESGLVDGEVLVVSDPVPAIEGMLLETTEDLELKQRLARVASGEAALR